MSNKIISKFGQELAEAKEKSPIKSIKLKVKFDGNKEDEKCKEDKDDKKKDMAKKMKKHDKEY